MFSKKIVWVGRVISGLVTFAFGMSALMKFKGGPESSSSRAW